MSSCPTIRAAALGVFCAGLAPALHARAQPYEPTTTADSGQVEEVVVTAQRMAEEVQTEPVSATVLGPAQLERSQVRNLGDLTGLAPNTFIDWLAVSPLAAGITIRGIGLVDTDTTLEPPIALIVDGVPLGTTSTALLANLDLESVEVIRGPQGALYGRNATGGLLSVRRTRPTGKLGLRAGVTAGTWGRNDYRAVANFPLVAGLLAGKLAFTSLNARGPFRNVVNGRFLPDGHYLSGTADLLLTPTRRTSLQLTYEHVRDREHSIPPQNASDQTDLVCSRPLPGLFTFDEPQCAAPGQSKFDVASDFRNDTGLDLDALTLRTEASGAGYRVAYTLGYRGDEDDVYHDLDGSPVPLFSTHRVQRYDQWSQELRVEGSPLEQVHVVAGFSQFSSAQHVDGTGYFLYEQPIAQQLIGRRFAPGVVRVQEVALTVNSLAGFLDLQADVVDRLRASLGARVLRERKSFANDWGFSNRLDPQLARELEANDDEPRVRARTRFHRATPQASLDYTVDGRALGQDNEALLYATYAQGFRSGGFSTRADPASPEPYAPERVDQVEAGVKSSWLARRLLVNVALFRSDYRDKQEEVTVASPTGGQQTLIRNAARAELRGLELELSTMPLHGQGTRGDGLRLWGNLGLLDASYRSFVVDFDGAGFGEQLAPRDHPGLALRHAPPYQFALGTTSPVRVADRIWLTLEAQYRRRGAYRNTFTMDAHHEVDRRGITPAYGQLDLSCSLELREVAHGTYRVTAFGRNVLDASPLALYTDVNNLYALRAYNAPSHWGVELAATF